MTQPQCLIELVTEKLQTLATLEVFARGVPSDQRAHLNGGYRILLAYSGGEDSLTLLDILAKLYHAQRVPALKGLCAFYVDHGSVGESDEGLQHAKAQALSRGVTFVSEAPTLPTHLGYEGNMRYARYEALKRYAMQHGFEVLMTAHHRDDALETFWIQWMRGAGLSGLVGLKPLWVPPHNERAPIVMRPFYSVGKDAIVDYVKAQGINAWEDPTNSDTRILRNALRQQTLPTLKASRPHYEGAALRSLMLLQEAQALLDEYVQADWQQCAVGQDGLRHSALLTLSDARQAAVLRFWLKHHGIQAPSHAQLTDTIRQIQSVQGNDQALQIHLDGRSTLRLRQDVMRLTRRQDRRPIEPMRVAFEPTRALTVARHGTTLSWRPALHNERGLATTTLQRAELSIRARLPSDRLQRTPTGRPQALKALFSQAGIAASERDTHVVLTMNDAVLAVEGLGVNEGLCGPVRDHEVYWRPVLTCVCEAQAHENGAQQAAGEFVEDAAC